MKRTFDFYNKSNDNSNAPTGPVSEAPAEPGFTSRFMIELPASSPELPLVKFTNRPVILQLSHNVIMNTLFSDIPSAPPASNNNNNNNLDMGVGVPYLVGAKADEVTSKVNNALNVKHEQNKHLHHAGKMRDIMDLFNGELQASPASHRTRI